MTYERILSLAPSNTEIICALHAEDKLVGATTLCDHPKDLDVPRVGSWTADHDIDAIAELEPDLILCSMFVPDVVQRYADEHGVRLVNLYPQTLDEVLDSFMEVGLLVDEETKAKNLIRRTQRQIKKVQENASRRKARIYTEEFPNPPTVGANWVPDLVRAAGAEPMVQSGQLSFEVDAEAVKLFKPHLVILHWCGFGTEVDLKIMDKRKDWQDIPAVKHKRIAIIDDTFLNRPGPRIWKGAKLIQQAIVKHLT